MPDVPTPSVLLARGSITQDQATAACTFKPSGWRHQAAVLLTRPSGGWKLAAGVVWRVAGWGQEWQPQGHLCAAERAGCGGDASPVGLGKRAHDRQAQTEAARGARRPGPHEPVEYRVHVVLRQSGSGVGDNNRRLLVAAPNRELDLVAVAGDLDGILHDRVQGKHQPLRVGDNDHIIVAVY